MTPQETALDALIAACDKETAAIVKVAVRLAQGATTTCGRPPVLQVWQYSGRRNWYLSYEGTTNRVTVPEDVAYALIETGMAVKM